MMNAGIEQAFDRTQPYPTLMGQIWGVLMGIIETSGWIMAKFDCIDEMTDFSCRLMD